LSNTMNFTALQTIEEKPPKKQNIQYIKDLESEE
jgi:hypothetical protein